MAGPGSDEVNNVTVTAQFDLPVGFNTMDETGLPWTFLDEAADPNVVSAGVHLVAGSG